MNTKTKKKETKENRSFGKAFLSKKRFLAVAIATVFLVAAVGNASANCISDVGGAVFGCGDTVTESCTFNANMNCAGGNFGLKVGADDITIDGNGFEIDGITPGSCEGIWDGFDGGYARAGIFSDGWDRVTIKDLYVTNFCNGIHIRGGTSSNHVDDIIIKGCTVYDNGNPNVDSSVGEFHGISWWSYIWDSSITGCTIYNTKGAFQAGGGGCDDNAAGINTKKYCDWSTIAGNTVHHNDLSGIFSKKRSRNCTVEYNYVHNNGYVGSAHGGGITMRCMNTDDWIVRHNRVENNIGPGIFCRSERANIQNNTVTGSVDSIPDNWPGAGVYLTADASDTSISNNNHLCENQYGVYNRGTDTTLNDNTICDNIDTDIKNLGTASGDENTCDTALNYHDDGAGNPPPCDHQCAGSGPDLKVSSLDVFWTSSYNIRFTVKNIGQENAGESHTSVKINGVEKGPYYCPSLNPGQTNTTEIGPFDLGNPPAPDTITVCVDINNQVNEYGSGDEQNNCVTRVFGAPDLEIRCREYPSNSEPDDSTKRYNITYTVTNVGDIATSANCGVSITEWAQTAPGEWDWVDPDPIPAGLGVGGEVTRIVGPFVLGEEMPDQIQCYVDYSDAIVENNEGGLQQQYDRYVECADYLGQCLECGDVDCSGGLPSGGDIQALRQKVYEGVALACDWSGDVDCSGGLPSGGDIQALRQKVYEGAAVNCCKGCELLPGCVVL